MKNRKILKKAETIILSACIAVSLFTPATKINAEEKNVIYKDGVYEGSAQGYMGNVKVSVTIESGLITEVKEVSNSDTPAFWNMAKTLFDKIKEAQSAEVDSVSGATYSSNGIKNAVAQALENAKTEEEAEEKTDENANEKTDEKIDVVFDSNIAECDIIYEDSEFIYDGTAKEPKVTVAANGENLKEGTDYVVTYSDNIDAGNANVKVTGIGKYTGETGKVFTIQKANQSIEVKKSKLTVKAGKSVSISAKASGKLSYSVAKAAKKYISVSAKGKISVSKKAKRGTYKVTVKAASAKNYNEAKKTVKVAVK